MMKVNEKVDSKEEKGSFYNLKYSPYFLANMGMFQIIGGLYTSYWLYPVSVLVIGELHVAALCYTAYVGWLLDDFLLMVEAIHFMTILATVLCAYINCMYFKKELEVFCKIMDDGLQDYGDTLDDITVKAIEDITKRKQKTKEFRRNVLTVTTVIALSVIGILRPVYINITTEVVEYEKSINLNRHIPLAACMPYNTYTWSGFILVILTEYFYFFICVCAILGCSAMFLCWCEDLCKELLILKVTTRNLMRRAKYVSKTENKFGEITTEILEKCLKCSVMHHQNIIKSFNLLAFMYYWLIFIIMTVTTFIVCSNLFLISSNRIDFGQKLTPIAFLLETFCHTLLYCYYGEEIQSLSGDIGYQLYKDQWFEHSVTIKNYALIVECRCLKKLKISGGGLIEANLNTFNNIMSSAYSYFNLLRASLE